MIKVGIVVIVVISFFGVNTAQNSIGETGPKIGLADTVVKLAYNPYAVGGASLLLPGAGQIYTKHYLKGGTFLAFEAVAVTVAISCFKDSKLNRENSDIYLQRAATDTGINKFQSTFYAALSRNKELFSRYRGYNTVAWAAGGYVFNVLDAIGCTNLIDKSGSRSPRTAGILAAIPGLGLGQWYNGSISKAGMILMAQASMGVVAYNYHKLMKNAEREIVADSLRFAGNAAYETEWRNEDDKWLSEQRSAFKFRNSYLWYSIFFYFYGIFDAVVDAHLHDYPEKMRITPDLEPLNGGAHFSLNMNY